MPAPAKGYAGACEENAGSALEGVTWQVTEYLAADGTAPLYGRRCQRHLQTGKLGNVGCNGFFAGYTVDGSLLAIAQGGSTMMACEDAIMAQEQAILAVLGQTPLRSRRRPTDAWRKTARRCSR